LLKSIGQYHASLNQLASCIAISFILLYNEPIVFFTLFSSRFREANSFSIFTKKVRQEVGKMLVLGMSQHDIARELNVSQPTINRDIAVMQESAREDLKTHVQKALPHTHLICSRGIDQVLMTAWAIVSTAKNDYIKIHALNLIHQCYITKQNLSTDGTVINGALELIQKSKRELQKLEGDISVESSDTEMIQEEVF
jgi:hypothetical protein